MTHPEPITDVGWLRCPCGYDDSITLVCTDPGEPETGVSTGDAPSYGATCPGCGAEYDAEELMTLDEGQEQPVYEAHSTGGTT